jgi:hypothetical protein
VLENGRLLGIVSLADIARRGTAAQKATGSRDIVPDEIATTLATICEPRPSAVV